MFTKDLETIDSLRNAAVNSLEPHFSGIKKLQAYAAQLVWIGGKFPIDVTFHFPCGATDAHIWTRLV
jgi:programmed cell death 6-interacting protein